MESRNKRLAKNTVFLYIRMFLVMGVSLYTSRIVLEQLGFTDYGVYNIVAGVVSIFGFLNGAMSGASSRFLTYELGRKDERRLNQVFNVLLFSHIGIALIVLVLCETVGLWLLYDKLVIPESQKTIILWVYQISVLSSVISVIIVPYSSILISYEDMDVYAYVGLGEAFMKLGAVLILTLVSVSKLLIYALLIFSIQITINLFYLIYCHRHYKCSQIKPYNDYKLYREIFGFVGGDLIGNISVLAQGQGLNLLLNIFFGPVVNAARAISVQVQGSVQQFSNNFGIAMRPQIIKYCAEKNYNEMFTLVKRGSYFSYYLLWLIILPVLLNSDYILTLWLGKFPSYTIPFLNIILWISLVQAVKTPRTMVFHGLGKIKLVNLIVGGLLVMTFPLAYVALKLGSGPTSVFWISLIVIVISEIVSVKILKRYISFSASNYLLNVHLRCIIVTIISAIPPYVYVQYHPTVNFWNLLLCIVITSGSIILVVSLIGIDQGTRKFLYNYIKTILNKTTKMSQQK